MEKISDYAFILNIIPHGSSSCVITLFSNDHGIITGYTKGGMKNQRKNNCFVGNLIEFIWSARVLSQLGSIEFVNTIENFSTIFDIIELSIINTVCEVVTLLLKKGDPHPNLFKAILELFLCLKKYSIHQNKATLLYQYIIFENILIQEIGFGYNFKQCNISGGIPKYISPKTGNVVSTEVAKGYESKLFLIPSFIINLDEQPQVQELKKMIDINLHFLKYHLEVQNLPVRSFMLSLF